MKIVHSSGCLLCDALDAWHREKEEDGGGREHKIPITTTLA